MRKCWHCDGRGWVYAGHGHDEDYLDPEGRPTCRYCKGEGRLTDEQVTALIARIVSGES